ncbi:AAA family ATPase [Halobacterium wangiae]|uniref:AAA family ATPase n=1 Tax=Halobacterium wangiae TaxID=2902623 RepID=UPI001E46B8EB|nr:AAA family ATPase [Halobacterium wangiae]
MDQQTRLTEDDLSEGEPQVFMMPVNRSRWLDEFKRTVDNRITFNDSRDLPRALEELDSTRIWGTQSGERNESMWGKLTPGDIMLFYSEGWFFAAGRIKDTIRSPEAGDYIWDNEDSEFIYTLTDYTHLAITKPTVWDWFGYKENFTRRGLARVSSDRVESLRREVGDIWEHILGFEVDEPIESILSAEPGSATSNGGTDSYFILRTGGGEYEDKPSEEYHFKEGIPGSRQLREAVGSAKFVCLEDEEFYAKGAITDIASETRDGTTHYFATISGHNEINPVSFDAVRDDLEPNFPIQYGIIKIPESDYNRIVSPEVPPSVTSYDSVSEATEDITTRLTQVSENRTQWFTEQLARSIIEDWTTAFRNFGPNTTVGPAQEAAFEQIRDLFEECKTDLEAISDEIGNGRLDSLSPAQTLFMVLLRHLQTQHGLRANANHVKLSLLFEHNYDLRTESGRTASVDHALFTHLSKHEHAGVYRFSAPPEYWLTSIASGAISFEAEDEDDWSRLNPDDVVLFYCQQTDLDTTGEYASGFIGAGVVGNLTRKPSTDPWWWDEHHNNESFPLIASFNAVYLTGNDDALPDSNPITESTTPKSLESAFEALTANLLQYDTAVDLCESRTGRGLAVSGRFSPFLDEQSEPDHERPRILLEAMAKSGTLTPVPPIDLVRDFEGALDQATILDGLHFEGDRGQELVSQVGQALRAGKHVIFTGPPGTGKTEVARRVASYLVDSSPDLYTDSQLTTATADWSTFDTVGGYMPDGSDSDSDELEFSPGVVLNRFKGRRPEMQRNEPLIIDELNRADIDKAFGQLFTVLSGQSVQLPYLKDGQEVELQNATGLSGKPASHQYVVPESWRIFATMNTYDKTSLYEMSYAFMRRFAFIRVEVPDLPADPEELDALIARYTSVWDDLDPDENERTAVGQVWRATNTAVENRSIGPAIIEDMLRYVAQGNDRLTTHLTQAVISFVFPQLEGVPERRDILNAIAQVNTIDGSEIERAAQDMLQVDSLEHA